MTESQEIFTAISAQGVISRSSDLNKHKAERMWKGVLNINSSAQCVILNLLERSPQENTFGRYTKKKSHTYVKCVM